MVWEGVGGEGEGEGVNADYGEDLENSLVSFLSRQKL